MRRIAAAVLAATALLAFTVTPADAQDIADLPRLGFEIDPKQGNVGDLVEGWVDTDDIQEHCLSFLDFWDAEFVLGVPVGTGAFVDFLDDMLDVLNPILFGIEPVPEGITQEQWDNMADAFGGLLFGLIGDTENIFAVYESLFVITFVDPVTQEMLGDMGGFDPATGEGSIVVPALDPALYAVAAACVTFLPNEELVEGGALIDALYPMNDWILENYPDGPPGIADPDFADFVVGSVAAYIAELVEPMAIGLDFYCILQADGFCATPPEPVGLIDEDVIDEFNGNGEPLGPPDGIAEDETAPAAVDARPAFTG